mmetsp:Transcript_33126/g.54162  ORF Transcript_33126/g.54162 Transcript_33126/m.54162 type:complete len:83 (+) Transcript_33126:782-1030(+)
MEQSVRSHGFLPRESAAGYKAFQRNMLSHLLVLMAILRLHIFIQVLAMQLSLLLLPVLARSLLRVYVVRKCVHRCYIERIVV